jgi:hypothetical protein
MQTNSYPMFDVNKKNLIVKMKEKTLKFHINEIINSYSMTPPEYLELE